MHLRSLIILTALLVPSVHAQTSPPGAAEHAQALKYLKGDGVNKDAVKAVELLTKAAEVGNSDAMVELAGCYLNGVGCVEDRERAMELYQRAKALGNKDADHTMTGVQKILSLLLSKGKTDDLKGVNVLTDSPRVSTVPEATNRLIQEARDDLEHERYSDALKKTQEAHKLLDLSKPGHWASFCHIRATEAAILKLVALKTADEEKAVRWAKDALAVVDSALKTYATNGATLRDDFPALYARLMEEKAWAHYCLSTLSSLSQKERDDNWLQMNLYSGFALVESAPPVSKARIYRMRSRAFIWRGKQATRDPAKDFAEALKYARMAVDLSDGQGSGRLIWARSLMARAESTLLLNDLRGIRSMLDSRNTPAALDIRKALTVFREEMPEAETTLFAAKCVLEFQKDQANEQAEQLFRFIRFFVPGGGGGSNPNNPFGMPDSQLDQIQHEQRQREEIRRQSP